jgi:toxin YoeB
MRKIFSETAWNDYIYWQQNDKNTLRKVNQLIKDIDRNSFQGIGKPEPLKGNLSGYWSRRIDDSNRIVYRINSEIIEIYQCRGHYQV